MKTGIKNYYWASLLLVLFFFLLGSLVIPRTARLFYDMDTTTVNLLSMVMGLVGLMVSHFLIRSVIIRPLERLISALNGLCGGDLEKSCVVEGALEITGTSEALERLRNSMVVARNMGLECVIEPPGESDKGGFPTAILSPVLIASWFASLILISQIALTAGLRDLPGIGPINNPMALVMVISAIALTALVLFMVQSTIVRPLARMAENADLVSRGEPTDLAPAGEDIREINALNSRFNAIVSALERAMSDG